MESINPGKENGASRDPVHVVVEFESPMVEGTIVDLPGWLHQSKINDGNASVVADKHFVKKISMECLETSLQSNDKNSLFLCVESISSLASDTSSSMHELIEYFKEKPQLATAIFARTIPLVNQFNNYFSSPSNDGKVLQWNQQNNATEQILYNLIDILQRIAGFRFFSQPILVGINEHSDIIPLEVFDNAMEKAAWEVLPLKKTLTHFG
jgi:hypothetical protein